MQRRFVHMKEMHPRRARDHHHPENWSAAWRSAPGPRRHGDQRRCSTATGSSTPSTFLPSAAPWCITKRSACWSQSTQSNLRCRGGQDPRLCRRATVDLQPQLIEQPGCIGQEFSIEAVEGNRCASKRSSRSAPPGLRRFEPALEASAAVEHAGGFDELLDSHALQWAHFVAAVRHPAGKQRPGPDDPQAAHLSPAADGFAKHHGPGVLGPGVARRGLPGAYLLGRNLHLPLSQPAHPESHPVAAALPVPAAGPVRLAARAQGSAARSIPGRAAATAGRKPSSFI